MMVSRKRGNQVPKCFIPTCPKPAAETFRETYLCKTHLEMARTWEFCFGGPVRLPTIAELKQARGSKQFAEYAIDYFLKMDVKYGAIDFTSGTSAYAFRKHLHRLIRERNLKIWCFTRGATSYLRYGKATVFLLLFPHMAGQRMLLSSASANRESSHFPSNFL